MNTDLLYISSYIKRTASVIILVLHVDRQCLGMLKEVSNVDSKQQMMNAIKELPRNYIKHY